MDISRACALETVRPMVYRPVIRCATGHFMQPEHPPGRIQARYVVPFRMTCSQVDQADTVESEET